MHIICCFEARVWLCHGLPLQTIALIFVQFNLVLTLIFLGWFFLQYKLCKRSCLHESLQMLQDKYFHGSICAGALVGHFTAFIKSVPFCKMWMFPSLVMFTLFLSFCLIIFGSPCKTSFWYQAGSIWMWESTLNHSELGLLKHWIWEIQKFTTVFCYWRALCVNVALWIVKKWTILIRILF